MNALDNNVKPHLERLAEIDRALAPSRAVYQAYGVKSDGEAVQRLFEWEHSLRVDPRNGIQRLAQQLGVDLRELVGGSPQQYQPQQYEQQQQYVDPVQYEQLNQQIHHHLSQFAQSHPHYEEARYAMGLLLQTRPEQYQSRDGSFDLEAAYKHACRNLGLGDNRSRQRAAVSPRSRAPAVRSEPVQRGPAGSVRNSLYASIDALR